MDRTLVGILLICFVGSSIPVFLFLGERASSPISVLKVDYPTIFGPEEPRRFALNILARQDIQDLTVEYAFLHRVNRDRLRDQLLASQGFNESVLKDKDPYKYMEEAEGLLLLAREPVTVEPFETQTGEVPLSYERHFQTVKTPLKIRFYDFRRMLEWVPTSAVPQVYGATTCFAFVRIPEGNISVFKGAPDFYLNRQDSLSDLDYGVDEESHSYVNPKIRDVQGEYHHVDDAPGFGTIKFGSLKKGQRAYLSFTTRDLALPAIQVVRFRVDGRLLKEETRFNVMGWPF